MIREKLEAIVGKKNVLDDEATLSTFSRDMSLHQPRMPSFVVRPGSTGEVQKLVKLANKHLVPLIPISSGVHFHGETIPEQGGIAVDLRRMDRILEY